MTIRRYIRLAAATLLAGALASGGTAYAYRYTGPVQLVSGCSGKITCLTNASQFTGLRVVGDWDVTASREIISFIPTNPVARGDIFLTSMQVTIEQLTGQEVLLAVTRQYKTAAGKYFSVKYPVTDPIAMVAAGTKSIPLDLTIYASRDQIWIESVQGRSALAQIWTVPLFFGFGPNGTEIQTQTGGPGFLSSPTTTFFTVAPDLLLKDINTNYTPVSQTTPFLFRGDRSTASALVAALGGVTQ